MKWSLSAPSQLPMAASTMDHYDHYDFRPCSADTTNDIILNLHDGVAISGVVTDDQAAANPLNQIEVRAPGLGNNIFGAGIFRDRGDRCVRSFHTLRHRPQRRQPSRLAECEFLLRRSIQSQSGGNF
jgi:hypothetical protein